MSNDVENIPQIERLREAFPEALTADGFDDCIIGVCQRFNQEEIVAYSINKIIEKLVKRDGMTEQEAYEFYEFNIVGAWVGEFTPCFVEEL